MRKSDEERKEGVKEKCPVDLESRIRGASEGFQSPWHSDRP